MDPRIEGEKYSVGNLQCEPRIRLVRGINFPIEPYKEYKREQKSSSIREDWAAFWYWLIMQLFPETLSHRRVQNYLSSIPLGFCLALLYVFTVKKRERHVSCIVRGIAFRAARFTRRTSRLGLGISFHPMTFLSNRCTHAPLVRNWKRSRFYSTG